MVSLSSLGRALTTAVAPLYSARPSVFLPLPGRLNTATPADLYRVLRAYYFNNALYDEVADLLRREGVAKEAMKGLRNPTFRAVEFHAARLWPGNLPAALPIQADRKSIIKPIHLVWKWSNWGATKQVAARHIALYGDMFIKIATKPEVNPTRVHFEMLEPEYVTDFDADERDYLTYCRIDVPRVRRLADGSTESYTHTEEWSRDQDRFRVWEHEWSSETPIGQIGLPRVDITLSEMGIDFVPISHAKFQDVGQDRGNAAVTPALDKIDEVNRAATRLHQQLWRHNNVTHALNGGLDGTGRPMPAPQVGDQAEQNATQDGTVTFGDEQFIALPGNSQLMQLVPNLNYEAALKILQDQMREIAQDLPEIVAYRLADEGRDTSGRAIRMMLGPAISRVLEARGNAEAALVRADQMALTMGTFHGLFRGIGTFERGDFEHSFEERDVLPTDELERAQAQQADGAALKAYTDAGMSIELAVQQLWGWSEQRAAQFTKENMAAIQREQALVAEDVVGGPAQ